MYFQLVPQNKRTGKSLHTTTFFFYRNFFFRPGMHCSVTSVSTGQYDSFIFYFLTQPRVPLGRGWTLHEERLYSNLPMGMSARNVLIDD